MRIIVFEGKKVPTEYLGDGVYAIFDGYGIWLHTNNHEFPTDKVYLEPDIFDSLIKFRNASRSEEVIKQCSH